MTPPLPLPHDNDEILAAVQPVVGQTITTLSYRPIQDLGLECLTLGIAGRFLSFRTVELGLGRFETYSLLITKEAAECDGQRAAVRAAIKSVELWLRDEWLEPSVKTPGILGNSPMAVAYGPPGSAPPDVDSRQVISACLFHVEEASGGRTFMISTNNYPGLINYSAAPLEIAEFCRTSSLGFKVPN